MNELRNRFTINTDAVILIAVMLATIIGGYYVATMSIITPPEQTFESPVDGAFFGVIAVVGATIGVVLSIGVLVASMENRDKGLPALPWVCSGAIGGYAVATIVVIL